METAAGSKVAPSRQTTAWKWLDLLAVLMREACTSIESVESYCHTMSRRKMSRQTVLHYWPTAQSWALHCHNGAARS